MGSLGDLLRDRRAALGMTQVELAEQAGVNQPLVSDIERGKTKLSNPDARRRIARALQVRHVDMLVAAGELYPEEVPGGEVEPRPFKYPEIVDLLESVTLSGERRWAVMDILSGARERDRRLRREEVQDAADQMADAGVE